jgi:hypothetical protein
VNLNSKLLFLLFLSFFHNLFAADVTYSTTTALTDDLRLSAATRALFTATATLDGDGFTVKLPLTPDPVIVISPGFTATTQDLFLKSLSPSHITLGAGSSIVFGTGTLIQMLKDEALNDTWKFSGTSTLRGNHSSLDLSSGGTLEVQAGGSLTLSNLTILGVDATNISCADNDTTITFDNVKLVISDTFNFDTGAFLIKGETSVIGGGTFSYESAYASTIASNSTFWLSQNVTFAYDPVALTEPATPSQLNLTFADATSRLKLDGTTLNITDKGMQLLSGTLEVSKENIINSDALPTNYNDGLIFGNQTYANDLNVEMNPGARLLINSGVLNYQNKEIPPPPPVRIGDAIVLKHKTYGCLLAPAGSDWSLATDNTVPTHTARALGDTATSLQEYHYWSVRPGDVYDFWGNPSQIGNQIFSGDEIIINSYKVVGNSGSVIGWSFFYDPSPVSTPSPPYYNMGMSTTFNSAYYTDPSPFRIHKKGGSLGDPILKGDEVYFYAFRVGTTRHHYIGSSGLSYLSGIEIYYYRNDSAPTQPPNFDTDFIWIVEDLLLDAHLTAETTQFEPSSTSGPVDFTGWPTAATTQF